MENTESWFTARFKSEYRVTSVALYLDKQFYDNNYLAGAKILVDDTECATLPDEFGDGGDAWVISTCPGNGIVGNAVRVEKDT